MKMMIDKYLQDLEREEINRLNNDIELIASENYPSQAVLDCMGSHFSVKYSEGFPREVSKQGRHYAGCHIIDKIENYAIKQACELFDCKYANVQPWSGSQANLAVYAGLLQPNDKILAMSLAAGGHLTHGSPASDSSKEYNVEYYGLDENGYINYEEIKEKLYNFEPRLLVVGASAYSRIIDFEKIRGIVDEYNQTIFNEMMINSINVENDEVVIEADFEWYESKRCYLMVDMAHIAGLVAGGVHPSPLPYADVVTSTTHKTLRGPRGGLILWNDEELCSKLNAGVFPRTQGGPNEACIMAKAQCFREAKTPLFKKYVENVLWNMQALINGIKHEDKEQKLNFVSGGSSNHLVLLDISKTGMYGKEAEDRLSSYGIICNKNMIGDDKKPSLCTGLRIGTAAITTRGFTTATCFELGTIIAKILLKKKKSDENTTINEAVVDFEDTAIRLKLSEMLKKVGPFYKMDKSNLNVEPIFPDDLA